ncbi:hypothetical protein P43SY_004490 [Pythium insidiosum]|uniref:Uncharacterized protein n=1 Tax=Pythium insidiosum TaxID=114742 RepID=A0AAD5LTY8_PYTIN|nr:hypothetical protein P43SY_004490 [Pythium insidiosum]
MQAVAPQLPVIPAPPTRPKAHPFIWLSVTSIHSVCFVYAGFIGLLYVRLPIDGAALISTMELYSVAVPSKNFKVVAAAYFVLAIVHVLILLRITYASVRFRGLLLSPPEDGSSVSMLRTLYNRITRSVKQSVKRSSVSRRTSSMLAGDAKLRSISNAALKSVKAYSAASNVTDPNYGKLHAIREIVETAFLTTQAYKSSYRVASPWINSVQIFLLVLNCWSFTLIDRLLRSSIGWTRLLCQYIHLCIDITIHIIIPLFLFLPYARIFNPEIGEFGTEFWYTDRWLVRVFNEFPMIFVTSLFDGVSKLFIVELTPIYQDLRNMVGFKVYNSTISRWNADAAITAQHHTRIMFVFLAATNMSEFPPGLYDVDFPPHLADIEICRSNLASLPDAVADVWPFGLFLILEELQLPAIPPVLAKLRPFFLSLAGNNITSLPTFVLQNPILLFLRVSGNPLSALPELTANDTIVPPVGWMWASLTNISDVPSWLDLDAMGTLDANETPLCARLLALDESSAMDAKTAALKRLVRCYPEGGESNINHFPIKVEPVINA